jgi:hypothetical protein
VLNFPPYELAILRGIPIHGAHIAILSGIPLALTLILIIRAASHFGKRSDA